MTRSQQACAFAVSFALVGCRPSAQSSADTTAAASSTVPAVTAAPVDSAATATTTGQSVSGSGSKAATGTTTAKKKASTSASRSGTATQDSGIIGRDSVIRFPVRGLPTVSSTPPRK
jgi:hypothetical protein